MAKIKLAQDLLNALFPVGSVVIRADTIDPKTLYGGTWALFPDNKYLMSSTDDVPGSIIQGSTETGYTTINSNQMPSHTHAQNSHNHGIYSGYGEANPGTDAYRYQFWAGNSLGWHYGQLGTGDSVAYNQNTGGSQGHTHSISYLQMPALNLRVWRRTV